MFHVSSSGHLSASIVHDPAVTAKGLWSVFITHFLFCFVVIIMVRLDVYVMRGKYYQLSLGVLDSLGIREANKPPMYSNGSNFLNRGSVIVRMNCHLGDVSGDNCGDHLVSINWCRKTHLNYGWEHPLHIYEEERWETVQSLQSSDYGQDVSSCLRLRLPWHPCHGELPFELGAKVNTTSLSSVRLFYQSNGKETKTGCKLSSGVWILSWGRK